MSAELKTQIDKLTDELNYHTYIYYQESRTEISDYEFDQKLKELENSKTSTLNTKERTLPHIV